MWDIAIFILGACVTGFVAYDFLRTAIGMAGLGPMTRRIAHLIWHAARRWLPSAERRLGLSLRGAIGPTILCAVALSWIVANLAGYSLMYAAGPSLVDPHTGVPGNAIERVAFAGSALSTLGSSMVSPANGWWDALSMVAAVNGMVILTLSVSFVMNIVSTTNGGHAVAARAHLLAAHAARLPPHDLATALAALGPDLTRLALDIRSAPLAGYFAPGDPAIDFARAVSTLCDLLERAERHGAPEGRVALGLAELRQALALLVRNDPLSAGQAEAGGLDAVRAWSHARARLSSRRLSRRLLIPPERR